MCVFFCFFYLLVNKVDHYGRATLPVFDGPCDTALSLPILISVR